MSVTTPRPPAAGSQPPRPANTPPKPPQKRPDVPAPRRTKLGASFIGLPVANLVVLEVGIAIGLVLVAVDTKLLVVGGAIAVVGLLVAIIRWRGRWFTQWFGLTAAYLVRGHKRVARQDSSTGTEDGEATSGVTGPDDARVSLLRLAVPDLVVAHGADHERRPVGLAYNDGGWTAVLLVDPVPALVNQIGGAPNLPVSALAPCLEDRGVLLDAIQVIWHCYPGSAALPRESPALDSYLEVLGPLPAAARRTTWVAVRLDPRRCAAAVSERGGGVEGAHRALIGALSRVRSALEGRGVRVRPLDPDEMLRAGIKSCELSAVAGSDAAVTLNERWDGVTAGGIGHASYSVTGWPTKGSLNAVTGVRALSSTVVMSIVPGMDSDVGLRGIVRVSARTPAELAEADKQLKSISGELDMNLTPLRGLQVAGLNATLPLGGTA